MSQCIIVREENINATLAQHAIAGTHLLDPFKSFSATRNLPFNILEDCQLLQNDAEVHQHEGDLWLCLEGEARFVTDGELINPQPRRRPDGTVNNNELYASHINGGNGIVLKPGDWLWVPPGQPHQHTCDNTARLIIIKIPKHSPTIQ